MLIAEAEKEAITLGMDGICVMTSKGSWLADHSIFERNGFHKIAVKDRFELLSKTWNTKSQPPKFYNWTKQQSQYQGWHLIYADQCPWHDKSASALLNVAKDYGIDLQVSKISTSQAAKRAPSGFGVFNLLHDGKLLDDHYLSATRFKNILQQELRSES